MRGFCRIGFALGILIALFAVTSLPAAANPLTASGYKMAGNATRMRIVIQFDRDPELRWFLLRGPNRLVIDLPDTALHADARDLKARGLVSSVRFGSVGEGRSRLILTARGPFAVERFDVVENEKAEGFRLIVDMAASSDREFEEALAEQAQTTGSTVSTAKSDRVGQPAASPPKPFTVVLDPGHGGIDGGAEGINGAVEKEITLSFARELKASLEKAGPYRVFLTRDKDEFLRLDERVRIARQHEADLLISIHADTIRLKGVRGATVYTVSDKASDAEAAALAVRENLADQLGGVEIQEEDHVVSDILVDLIRRETHSFSLLFARSLLGELSSSVELINNPHREAGFRVLKAPDVPSVLVELGYLSNEMDEAQLRDPRWRGKAAQSIAAAVADFAAQKARVGG